MTMTENPTPLFPCAELVTRIVAEIYEKVYVKFAMEDPYNHEKVMSGELMEEDFEVFGREGELEILEISKSFISQNWRVMRGEKTVRECLETYVPKWLQMRNERHVVTRDDNEGDSWKMYKKKNIGVRIL